MTFFNEPCDIDRLSASPYDTLYKHIRDKLGGDYLARAEVFDPLSGIGPVLPRPSDVLMMQGWLYEPHPVTGRMQVHKNTLLLINVSAIRSLANLVGGPDVRELLTHESRAVLCFHRLDDMNRTAPPNTRWRVARSVHQPHLMRERITSDTTYRGYDCRLIEVDDSVEMPTHEDHEAMVPWERVARRLPAAEQVRLLKMALPRELVETGFTDTEFDCYL